MFRFENKPSSRIMLEKVLSLYVRKKNSITRGLGKNLTQTKSPIPPLKSQMVGSQFLSR